MVILTLRSLRTLFPRIERQQANAAAIAHFLEKNEAVSAVHYPGLPAHPGHARAKAQQDGFGAMLSFELAGGLEAVRRSVETIRIFTLAESLGGVESLVAHPAIMTHAGMGLEARQLAGIADGLLRLSVGLEAEADLLAYLERGLGAAGVRATLGQSLWSQHVAPTCLVREELLTLEARRGMPLRRGDSLTGFSVRRSTRFSVPLLAFAGSAVRSRPESRPTSQGVPLSARNLAIWRTKREDVQRRRSRGSVLSLSWACLTKR